MSTPYSPKCQRCGHGADRHANGTGKCKCSGRRVDETLRKPGTLDCFCDRFAPGKTLAQHKAQINREITAAYHAGRDGASTHGTRA